MGTLNFRADDRDCRFLLRDAVQVVKFAPGYQAVREERREEVVRSSSAESSGTGLRNALPRHHIQQNLPGHALPQVHRAGAARNQVKLLVPLWLEVLDWDLFHNRTDDTGRRGHKVLELLQSPLRSGGGGDNHVLPQCLLHSAVLAGQPLLHRQEAQEVVEIQKSGLDAKGSQRAHGAEPLQSGQASRRDHLNAVVYLPVCHPDTFRSRGFLGRLIYLLLG